MMSLPLFAEQADTYEEHFDQLREGVINTQDGWKSSSEALVQTQVNATSGGKALQLTSLTTLAEKNIIPQGMTGEIAIDMMVRCDSKTDKQTPKFLIYLQDSKGKNIAMLFYDEAGHWGVMSVGNDYSFARDSGKPAVFQGIRILLNLVDHKVSLYAADGANWKPLLADKKLINPEATDFAKLRFARNGQGDPGPVYVDQILIHPFVKEQPKAVSLESLKADTPAKPGYGIFHTGETVTVDFDATRKVDSPADTLQWQVVDWQDKQLTQGSMPVSAGAQWHGQITLPRLPAGYFKLTAQLKESGLAIEQRGSRPGGMITLGVVPALEPLPLKYVDESRFGAYGTNFIFSGKLMVGEPFKPLYPLLGAHWVEMSRRWMQLEPDHAGEFIAPLSGPSTVEDDFKIENQLSWILTTAGSPAWAMQWPDNKMPQGKMSIQLGQAYPPKNDQQYADFLTAVAQAQVARRKNQTPWQHKNYYHIHHEPDWHWKGTDEQFINMYKVAHTALHAADPDAVLLGPRYGVLAKGVQELERLLPMGLGQYLDGISTHIYYLPPHMGSTPEQAGIVENLRKIRSLMKTYLKPDALLVQSEWGTYERGTEWATSDVLRRHAMVFMRGHLIALGEGVDVTYMFYTSDYSSGGGGYGMTFNLNLPDPTFGATAVSPKPTFMAAAAMTRLLENTQSMGHLELGDDVLAYQFKRANQYVLAIWAPSGALQDVTVKIHAKTVQHFDLMGNPAIQVVNGGVLSLQVDGYPSYYLSDASFEVHP
jgi:hypothetical protein